MKSSAAPAFKILQGRQTKTIKVTVVIPALNEEKVIGETTKLIKDKEVVAREAGFEFEILVVDNGSTDATAEEAVKAGAKIVLELNKGYGSALRAGFNAAEGDVIVMGDADLTYPLEDFVNFVRPIFDENIDVMNGNRYHSSVEKGSLKLLNKYGGRFLSITGNLLFGTKLRDWYCGMKAFKKDTLKTMDLKSDGWELALEILIKSKLRGLKVKQVDIDYRVRGGQSKLNVVRDGLRSFNFILKSYFFNRR